MKRIFSMFAALLLLCGVAQAGHVSGSSCDARVVSGSSSDVRVVSGSVRGGRAKLAGVVVTDGKNFTLTDRKGRFELDVDDNADFVYVLTPAGYTAPIEGGIPHFYLPVDSKNFDFNLVKTSTSKDYTILAMSDPQMKKQKHYDKFIGAPLDDLCATAADHSAKHPTVAIALGDIGWDSCDLIFPQIGASYERTGIPVYSLMGNHDNEREFKGDRAAAAKYHDVFGPENYAFFLGSDCVIVLDNIIYDTQKKYVEGFTDAQLDWVKALLAYVPKTSHVFLACHSPIYRWFKDDHYIVNGESMLDLFDGYEVTVLSGHSHINNNTRLRDNINEWNVAAICGAWWSTWRCNDGTPSGYKIIEKTKGEIVPVYKSIGKDLDYQVEFCGLGQSVLHPNAVLVNAWDWNDDWKTEWWQDGEPMGALERVIDVSPDYIREIQAALGDSIPKYRLPRPNTHYFAAEPSLYAKKVDVVVTDDRGKQWKWSFDMDGYCDVQPHRGGAGLMPQNTISAMKNAIDLGCNTLEMDFQISGDGKVFVSHENYFHPGYSVKPDGTPVTADEAKILMYQMNYDEIVKYETGLRVDSAFPDKVLVEEHKPLASDLIDFVESYTREKGLSKMRYNIEIKTTTRASDEGVVCPEYREFCDKVMKLLLTKSLGDRLIIQIFDVRALKYMHEKYPQVRLAYLTNAKKPDYKANLDLLGFTPDWYSPNYLTVNEEMVKYCKERGIRLVPWTADSPEDIKRMIDLGCEAVITNYPDRMLELTRGYIRTDFD